MVDSQKPEIGDKRRVRQSPQRGHYDVESLHRVLDACSIGHVSFMYEDWPQSVPTAIARINSHLYLHGHPKSRLFSTMSSGVRICVSAMFVTGLVKARSAFHCSMNYQSAVVFGCAEVVSGEEKIELLDAFTEHLIPGSRNDFRPHLPKELKGTMLLRLPLTEFSVKIRTGDPVDDKDDLDLPFWAGVIPINVQYGTPVPSSDLPPGTQPHDDMLKKHGLLT